MTMPGDSSSNTRRPCTRSSVHGRRRSWRVIGWLERLHPLAPGGRWRFRHQPVARIRGEQLERLLHRALELWIPARDHILRPVLDVDVRRDPLVLDRPLVVAREEAEAR